MEGEVSVFLINTLEVKGPKNLFFEIGSIFQNWKYYGPFLLTLISKTLRLCKVFDSEAVLVSNGGEAEAKAHPCSTMDAKPCRRVPNRGMPPWDPPYARSQAIFSFVLIICIHNAFPSSSFSIDYDLKLTSATFSSIFIIYSTSLEISESLVGYLIGSTGTVIFPCIVLTVIGILVILLSHSLWSIWLEI